MTEKEPDMKPAITADLQTISHVRQSVQMLRVSQWGVLHDSRRNFVEVFLQHSDKPEIYSHVLSIPAAHQLSEALRKSVDEYLEARPDPDQD